MKRTVGNPYRSALPLIALVLIAVGFPVGSLAKGTRIEAATPTYAIPADRAGTETVRGRVTWFDRRYALQLRDDRGFIADVQLRQGTVIHPTGLTLRPGMHVEIHGRNRGLALVADQIDSPGTEQAALPAPPAHAQHGSDSRSRADEIRNNQRLYEARMKEFRRAQILAAHAAAQRLAAKLERLYGHRPAHVAATPARPKARPKPHHLQTPAPPAGTITRPQVSQNRPAAPKPAAASRHTSQRRALPEAPTAAVIPQPWFGWGKL